MKSIASYLSLPRIALHPRALRTLQDIEHAGLVPLGSIGWFKQAAASTHPTAGYSHMWDAYRTIATQTQTMAPDAKVIVVTSASPEEGKSTTAANLATALARDGQRIVLIDANLRWPSLRNPNRDDTTFGLAELLINSSLDPQHGLARTSERGLYLLPSGDAPSTTGNLLATPRLPAVLEALRDAMDYVIVDAPPLLENEDAALLARAADATVLVVEAGKTRRYRLEQAVRALSDHGVSVAGAVLNRAALVVGQESPAKAPASPPIPALPIEPALAETYTAPESTSLVAHEELISEDTAPELEPDAPRLRLIQPYERPLLPFGDEEAPGGITAVTPTTATSNGSLEITVEELLVDLEETLSLIRYLRSKQASGEGG